MSFDRKLTLRELFGSLSGRQARLVGLSGLVLLSVAYIAGALIQSGRDEHNFSGKQQHFSTMIEELQGSNQRKDDSLAELAIRNGEFMQRLAALEASFAGARADNDMLSREITFLNRYIAYGQAQGDLAKESPAKQSLVDSLCALWKNGEKLHVRFERQPLDITLADIAQGRVTAEIKALLVQNFISLEPLQPVRMGDVVAAATPATTGVKAATHQAGAAAANAEQAFASLQKQLSTLKILKSISFSDGARYDVPKVVAVALQIRRECAPY
jgi:hypothetical protein